MGDAAIRPATADDAASLARLFRASRAAAMPWLATPHTADETEAWFRDHVLRNLAVRVAIIGQEPVGFIARADAWIEHLYIAADHRRRGLGAALLRAATGDEPPVLRLRTFARNAAARCFYEAHGFAEVGRSDGSTNEEGEPDILYERRRGAPTDTGDPQP